MATKEKTASFSEMNFTLKEVLQIIGVVGMACALYFGIVNRLEKDETEISQLKEENKRLFTMFYDMQKDIQKANNQQLDLLQKIADEKDTPPRSNRRR